MDILDPKSDHADENQSRKEIRISAQVVSRGAAVGHVVCLHGKKRQFYRTVIDPNRVDREVRRFRAAIRLVLRQLTSIGKAARSRVNLSASNIVGVHALILGDVSLLTKIEDSIIQDRTNAEWAVKVVTDSYIGKFKAMGDEHLRARYVDIEDVAERMLTALGGGRSSPLKLEKNSIVVAKEINPSTLIELVNSEPSALVTEHGGWTSHTFILAREVNVPAITGIKRILRRVQTGDTVIVDGQKGLLILDPTDETLREYDVTRPAFSFPSEPHKKHIDSGVVTKTLDERIITIRANVDFPFAFAKARSNGARGVGLYRSEFLFNQNRGYPSETEQIDAYAKIAALAGGEVVNIRTFDLSADRLTDQNFEKEKNPALGLRAIRLSLSFPEQFKIQLRAILIASYQRKMGIVIPMISDVSELRKVREMISQEKAYLRKRGTDFGDPKLGAMIEIPAAVFVVDEIAAEVDFLSIGTNDLVQYFLAVDRDNESVADWFQTLHPAIVRAVRKILTSAEAANIPAIVCGEMAGSPFYLPLLIGLGAKELSMNINSISGARDLVNGISYSDTIGLAEEVLACKTAEESLAVVKRVIETSWAHLIPGEVLTASRRS